MRSRSIHIPFFSAGQQRTAVRIFFLLLGALLIQQCSTTKQTASENSQSTEDTLFATEVPDTLTQSEITVANSSYINGMRAFENKDYEKALDLLMNAYVKLPEKAGINYAIADTYLQMDDLVNASYYGKKAVEQEPDNKWYRLKLAEIYRESGKNEATINELEAVLETHPKDLDVLYQLAGTFRQYGERLKANEVYNRIQKLTGPDLSILMQKFENFNALNMTDSAISELEKMRELDPDNLNTLQTLSQFHIQEQQYSKARDALEDALDRNPRDPKSLVMMADLYLKQDKWNNAGSFLNRVVSDSLISPQAKMEVIQFLFSYYQNNRGNKELQQVTGSVIDELRKQEPDYGMAHAIAAEFYNSIKETDKALDALAETNRLMPENDSAWKQRIQLLYQNSHFEKVIKVGQQADENVPEEPVIQFFIGSSYMLNGNNTKAVEWLEKATKGPARKNLKSIIYGSLGDAHTSLDQFEQAFEAYDQALSYDPNNDTALNNYAYYLSLQDKRLKEALKMAEKALKLTSENSSYLDTLGWIHFKLGNIDKAEEYIQRSIDTGGASATVFEHMGDLQQKKGNMEKARKWWKKALDKDPSREELKNKIAPES